MMRLLFVIATTVLLTACASGEVKIKTLPPDTPAANMTAAVEHARELAKAAREASNAQTSLPLLTPAEAPSMRTYDPWERMNRFTYRFNARFDEHVFLPAANGYRKLPEPLRDGVHNFFGNLGEVVSTINYALQARPAYGVRSLGRFVINSTVGIGGLFDVAKKMDLPSAPTGFGTTLAKWGMHPGPYLVLPLLGPSTLRESIGLGGDYAVPWGVNVGNLYQSDHYWMLGVTNSIDLRANIDFSYYETGSAFEYEMVRFLYVRKLLLQDEGLHANEPVVRPDPDKPAGQ